MIPPDTHTHTHTQAPSPIHTHTHSHKPCGGDKAVIATRLTAQLLCVYLPVDLPQTYPALSLSSPSLPTNAHSTPLWEVASLTLTTEQTIGLINGTPVILRRLGLNWKGTCAGLPCPYLQTCPTGPPSSWVSHAFAARIYCTVSSSCHFK